MRIEHVGINVAQPREIARWYVEHVGFTVARQQTTPPYTHFLADETGCVLLEVYDRQDAPQWTRKMHAPLLYHLALRSSDLKRDRDRLVQAGASIADETIDADGFGLVMLRDPWGIPLQLCNRREPFESRS
jgi:catechol-2,3-dioxygenase